MRAPRSTTTRGGLLALAVAVGVAVLHGSVPSGWTAVLYALTINGFTATFLVSTIRELARARGLARWTWAAIAAYACGVVVSQWGWTSLGLDGGPSSGGRWPDLVYVVSLPLGVVGLLSLAFTGIRRGQHLRVLTDAAVVAFGLSLLTWVAFFAVPVSEGRLAGRTMAMAYPFLDLVAGAVIITACIYQPHRPRLVWLSAVIPCAAVSDALSALHDPSDPTRFSLLVLWIAAPVLLTAATRERDRPDDATFPIQDERRHLVGVFLAIGVVGALWAAFRDGQLDGPALAIAIGLGISVFVNQSSVFRELRGLIDAHTGALDALRASEAEFRLTFEGAPVGMLVFERGELRAANPTAVRMLGVGDRIGTAARGWVSEDVIPRFGEDAWRRIAPSIEVVDCDFAWPAADGTTSWMHLSLSRDPTATDGRVIAIVEDVTERQAATERLEHLAIHDPLTGLPNRSAFMAELVRVLEVDGRDVAVAFLDLDRFKVINDSVGHAVGDRMLLAAAERLGEAIGDAGMVARFAGDEFTVLLVDHDRDGATAVLERVRRVLGAPLTLADGVVTYPTASIGVGFGRHGDDADELLARADAAMYRTKERGRNGIELYDESRPVAAASELRTVGEMHRALEREEFRVVYQPVVDVATHEVTGYEALVRWQHPQRGLLAPGEFIEAAEASGLILPIGEWVMREALTQLATWRRRSPDTPLTMAVNVAARQVTADLPDRVSEIIADTGVEPSAIWLELTESALMFDIRSAEHALQCLREIGVHISVDDFGTGYSSLTYLQRLPIEGIKLDRSFVAGLGRDERDRAICAAVTSLGRALGLRTVGEGVETPRQLELLDQLGCELAQGFLFGRPEAAQAIDASAATRDADGRAARASSTTARTSASATR